MAGAVCIRAYEVSDAAAFRDINLDWIGRYFVVEAKDHTTLDDPRAMILDKGGSILIATRDDRTVGCVALIPMEDGVFELAKMGVLPNAQGSGVGRALVAGAIAVARKLRARELYLETNSALKPAIKLYLQAGFQHIVPLRPSPYARADVQMRLSLE